ncbi:MAG: hypothetical protein K6E34_08595 [Lachnospiraceae bacterium]|nr:hypothetical protein [Lachnospiraceae bacterium]
MTNDDGKNLEELFKDQDFAKKVLLDETPGNARELLKEKGVDVSIEEIGQIRDFVDMVKNGEISEEQLKKIQDGELEPEDMKQIAGGRAVPRPQHPIVRTLFGVLVREDDLLYQSRGK